MKLVTMLRWSLLGPFVIPPIAVLIPTTTVSAPGLIMFVGTLYYGIGYGFFALGALRWLRVPRTDRELQKACLFAPMICSAFVAGSIYLTSVVLVGIGSGNDFLGTFGMFVPLSAIVGYAYVGTLLLMWNLAEEWRMRRTSSAV